MPYQSRLCEALTPCYEVWRRKRPIDSAMRAWSHQLVQSMPLFVFRSAVEVVVLACTELPMIPVTEFCEREGRAPPSLLAVDPGVLLAEALLDSAARAMSS